MSDPSGAGSAGDTSRDDERRCVILALILSALAGFVDAAGYIALDRIYAANMSGNTVTAAIHALGRGDTLYPLTAIGAFVIGMVLSGVAEEIGRRTQHRMLALVLAVEAVLLVAFWVWARTVLSPASQRVPGQPVHHYGLVTVLALAMGLQNGSLTQLGSMTVFTTHVTGTLAKFSLSLGQWIVETASSPWRLRTALGRASLRTALLFALLWIVFLTGGVAGAWAQRSVGAVCLLAVSGVLLVVIAEELA